MRCNSFVYLLIINLVAAFGAEVPTQEPTPESIARRRFNPLYVKVIVPDTIAIVKCSSR